MLMWLLTPIKIKKRIELLWNIKLYKTSYLNYESNTCNYFRSVNTSVSALLTDYCEGDLISGSQFTMYSNHVLNTESVMHVIVNRKIYN